MKLVVSYRSPQPKGLSEKDISQQQIFTPDHFRNFRPKDTGRRVSVKQVLTKYRILQNCYALRAIFLRNAFHGELQSYSRAHKQNAKPERNRQDVISIIECYKDFHLYDKCFYFPKLIQESDPVEKKTLAKRSEFLLFKNLKFLVFLNFTT